MKRGIPDTFLILFVCVVWAGNYFVIKGVLPDVDPITFAFLRASLGAIFVFSIGGYAVRGLTRRDLRWLLALGLFNIALFLVLLNASLLTANEGVSSTLVYTQPVVVAGLSPLLGEKLSLNRALGISAAFLGIVVIFIPSIVASTFVAGDVFALGASFSWAIAVLLFKRWKTRVDVRVMTSMQSAFGAAFMLPLFAFERPFVDPTLSFWVFLGYNVILASGIAYLVYWKILARMPAAQFTSYFFLVPVFATMMAAISQLTIPPVYELAGTVLVAIGIIAVNK